MPIANCHLVKLPKISDARGSLSFVEGERHIPFSIARIFYVYDVPEGGSRGGHAHRELHEFIIPISGRFEVTLDDGREKKTFTLDRRDEGLHVPPMHWIDLSGFSSAAVCCVLASDPYDADDYLRDYEAFKIALERAERGAS